MTFLEATTANDVLSRDVDRDWWRGAVIYQIYPRSFQDSNGDGIGDLSGIIQRLQYVADLGVDAVWLSPFFKSPMLDFGYDVSDYRDVDPMFGTLGDFDALIARAHELGLKVLIDLVLSHTSDQHPWFQESRQNKTNPKADWFVWADAKPDGTPPNNWLSIFGGPAWEWDGERMQYYLHNFLREQPDLNFHCPDVQDALLDVARFWLDRGVDGFRLDTVNFYVHDKELRDNPALTAEQRASTIAPSVNPYTWQDHKYSKTQPENIAFLERLRALMDEYPAITSVGEVGDDQRGLQVQAEYTAGTERLHMCYGFDFLSSPYPSGARVQEVLQRFEDVAGDSWACWAYSNHDVERHRSRWSLGEAAYKLYTTLLMAMKGSVCIYQGEELGLGEAYVPFEDLQDPYGKRFWPKFKGRDGCRTPMAWITDNRLGGFTEGHPWLPVAVEHLGQSVAAQEGRDESLLSFYRAVIAFRQDQVALRKGSISEIKAGDQWLSFERTHGDTVLYCAFNLSGTALAMDLPEGSWEPVAGAPYRVEAEDTQVKLPAWGAAFMSKTTA